MQQSHYLIASLNEEYYSSFVKVSGIMSTCLLCGDFPSRSDDGSSLIPKCGENEVLLKNIRYHKPNCRVCFYVIFYLFLTTALQVSCYGSSFYDQSTETQRSHSVYLSSLYLANLGFKSTSGGQLILYFTLPLLL